ncbi:hypothetical protein MJ877_22045 [Mesorhizobium jarvisii]|nr:hypothetical protein [Mesorhizobium loti]MCH4558799.1 hypothetical protein [Mesorhizobium jarvisii]
MGTLVLAHEATFLQAAEDVSHHRTADIEVIGDFYLDDPILAENDAAGDVGFDRVVDALPGRAALKRFIGMLQNDKAERLYVGAVGHDIATLRADKKTSALEAMDKAFGFEA